MHAPHKLGPRAARVFDRTWKPIALLLAVGIVGWVILGSLILVQQQQTIGALKTEIGQHSATLQEIKDIAQQEHKVDAGLPKADMILGEFAFWLVQTGQATCAKLEITCPPLPKIGGL